MTARLLVTVFGTPGPQGSKTSYGKGRMVESSKKVKPWRAAVRAACLEAITDPALFPLQGPVGVVIAFTLRKPSSAPKRTRTWPSVRPDLDKLIRSTFDAIGSARVWVDDAQVIDVRSMKCYPGEAPWSLSAPGAVIHVFPAPTSSPDGPGGAETNRATCGVGAFSAKEGSVLDSSVGTDRAASADGPHGVEGGA